MDISLPDCSWRQAEVVPGSLLTLRSVRDNLEQYRWSGMSGIESAASMFLRSGSPAADDANWHHHHCCSCEPQVWSVSGNKCKSAVPANLLQAQSRPVDVDNKSRSYTIQDLIRALQAGGSRSKMEAAITVRSLAAASSMHQVALVAGGGIRPLVDLLSYEAAENHWPPEMREKATITVRAEAALALASLSVSSDDNKAAIGAAGAIPLLCDLIQFDEESYSAAMASYQKQEMAPFLILARDAGAGALSCLAKVEINKEAIVSAQAVPVLVRMVDRGTSFGRAAAANILAKLATGSNSQNKLLLGKEGAIAALLRLLKDGSPKARETAAEALFNLAMDPWNKSTIIQEGGMACLLNMSEAGSQAEKEAATAASKVLRSSGGTPLSRLSEGNNGELETFKNDGMQRSKELVNDNPQASNDQSCASLSQGHISVLKAFRGLATAPLQSELTSSLAPPLVGQPSVQADSAVHFTKSSPHTMSRKKIKLAHAPTNVASQYVDKAGPLVEAAGRLIDDGAPKLDALQMYAGDRAVRSKPSSWDRSSILGGQQGVQSPSYQERQQLRLRHSKQGVEASGQPVAGGIFALVNALSSQNPGAQEFSALALMLLASQGGYEVKTAIADAGAIEPLISMVGNSNSPLIRESAAAAIAKLVSCHPGNRAAVIRAGGIKAMVDMAKWSSTLVDGPSGGGSLGARTQAAAIVAVLNISDVLDRHSMGMGLRDALPCLAQMLESENVEEITAGVAGLQIVAVSLGIKPDIPFMNRQNGTQQEYLQPKKFDFVAVEMVTALLDLMRGSSLDAKDAATEALAGLATTVSSDGPIPAETWRKAGIEALFVLLRKGPATASTREIVAGTVACVVASPMLSTDVYESALVPDLMRLVQEGPTIATRILAAAAVANLGGQKKRLDAVTDADLALLLRILGGDLEFCEPGAGADDVCFLQPFSQPEKQPYVSNHFHQRSMPYMLLCEHASAILVYAALSGETRKQAMIDLGAAQAFVKVLQSCITTAESCLHPSYLQGVRPLNPVFPQATQEFAMMGLILLADKCTDTMDKIVKAGGIPVLIRLLGATGDRGKLGASWSEMAAAALLTMAGSEAAREEMISVGGISSLVQVLKGEGGASLLSLTGLAAIAQLLGVLASKSEEAKLQMAKTGSVRCLVEILVGGGCIAWVVDGECCPREGPGFLALAQEAAAAALATVVLHCAENAEAAVEAGAIGPLVRLLSATGSAAKAFGGILELGPAVERGDSGANSAETGLTEETKTTLRMVSSPDAGGKAGKLMGADEEDMRGNRYGGCLAAMAALGNIISCFPQCRREIIDAGGLTKLIGILQAKAAVLSNNQADSEGAGLGPECHQTCPMKLQESAALVLGLLAEGDPEAQETVRSAGVVPNLIELSALSKNDAFTLRALTSPGKEDERKETRITEADTDQEACQDVAQ